MTNDYPPIHYSDYLKVPALTDLQSLRSKEFGKEVHDEMLFIVIHQVYELWFKQILFELDSAISVFSQKKIEEREMLTASKRLERIIEIQKILVDQVTVLETMTPMDFLEFRDYLYPASGFQSTQFKLIENKLGLVDRITYNNKDYKTSLVDDDQDKAKNSENTPSLFSLLENWLERIPFLSTDNFDFWKNYHKAVEKRMNLNRAKAEQYNSDEATKKKHLDGVEAREITFKSIFDVKEYEKMQKEGLWRISHKALRGALFIYLYRDEPILQLPFNILTQLQTIDENFTQWRYRHALMVHRMIGVKMGTGGSSGHKYLREAGDKHKVFQDLNNLATFFLPKSDLPELPDEIREKLRFKY
ncbi:MAG: tryptophan 2,3-dioxygenase [Bdellovibrionales bacterium]|nr:tryptophan 2,3-dioxygenase [Bdellovibrionales bacterium]NQZ18358.1 tryptophan 2,3-dioxygenase [Bdellovibrionales bacterium]